MPETAKPDVTLTYPRELVRSPEPPPGVALDESVYVTMRDGIRLAVDVYRPIVTGRYPALLSVSPYSKDIQQKPPHWSHAIESGATGFYVPKGYVHVIAQARGAGLSQGQWNFLDENEQHDGYDLVEWIAAQPWCDGNVGMIGDSYWSWSQYHTAAQQPPHLKCICPCDGTTDIYRDLCYQGGVYHHGFLSGWIHYHTAMMAWPGDVAGKLAPMNLTYELARRPYDGPWYWERSAHSKLDRIAVPIMNIAPQGGQTHFRGQLWGYPQIKAPKKLIVVPPTGFWSHLRYLTNRALNQHMLRWFDHWLKGIDTGIMQEPEVAIFDPGTRQWRYENEYPLKRTQWTPLFLREGASLSLQRPADEAPDRYRMPDSYGQLTAGKPVLSYATPPLDRDLRVWGPASLTLHAASSAIDTVWFVKVFDVPPSGPPQLATRGILKASFREVDAMRSRPGQPYHPFQRQELLEPNRSYEFQIELSPLCRTFKQGHRIELQIASEDLHYTNFLRQIDVQLLPWPVENTIHHDRAQPSHLLLAVIPDAAEIRPVEPTLAQVDWPLVPGSWLPHTDEFPLRD